MKIEAIVWRKVIFGQIRRVALAIPKSSKLKLRADHALEWGNKNENPGVWSVLIGEQKIPITPDNVIIHLNNSVNDLKLWQGDNDVRGNKIKISQRIWEDGEDIIDVWYLGCLTLLNQLIIEFNLTDSKTEDSNKLEEYTRTRMEELKKCKGQLYSWAQECIKGFGELEIDCEFLKDKFFKEKKKNWIEKNYFLIMKYVDDSGIERVDAVMANLDSPDLHTVLKSNIKGNVGSMIINQDI